MAIPETVADEYLAHYERRLEELGSQVVETFRHLKALCSVWGQGMTIGPPDSADETQRHRQVLESTFEVLPLASGAAGEALRREAYRQLPTSGGRGARDAAIWLTILAQAPCDSRTYMVAKDRRAFGDRVLHGELAEEAMAHGVDIVLATEINDMLDVLAIHEQLARDAGQALSGHDIVREAVRDELFHPLSGFNHMLGVPWHATGTAFMNVVQPPTFEARVLESSSIYRVGKAAWANLRGQWIVTAVVDREIDHNVEHWQTQQGIELAVLVQVDNEQHPVAAQVIHRRPAVSLQVDTLGAGRVDR